MKTNENTRLIMHAIAHEIEWMWDVRCNPKNEHKDMTTLENNIIALANEYFTLRGHSGSVCFITGVDDEVNTVSSIRDMVYQERAKNEKNY